MMYNAIIVIDICTLDMNINDLTVSWQDISDTERTALLNKRTFVNLSH